MSNKNTWHLEKMYNSKENWNKHYDRINMELLEINNKLNNLEVNQLINKYSYLLQNRDILFGYIRLKLDKNSKEDFQEQLVKIEELNNNISKLTSKIDDRILLNRKKIYPNNKRYIEKLLINNKKVNYNIYNKLNSYMNLAKDNFNILNNTMKFRDVLDSRNKTHEITINSFSKILRNKDRELRKNSFKIVEEQCKKNSNKFAKYLNEYIKANIELKKNIGYKDCLTASLLEEEITKNNYDIAIKSINDNKNIFIDILKIRKEKLKLNELYLYDLFAQIDNKANTCISFNKAKRIIIDSLSILGDEYIKIVKRIFDENWIDIYEENYKIPSARSYNIYGYHPYILLNFQYSINDIFIMAHEIGHAVHYYLSNTNQEYLNAQVTSLSTEIAAMINECLVYNYLLKQENKEKTLIAYLDKFRIILCKQSMLNEFENIIYSKIQTNKYVDSENLCDIYKKIIKKYYGSQIKVDENVFEWTRVPHLYKGFHVYKYIIAFCIAIKISNQIVERRQKYIDILKKGSSSSIGELLKIMDIDLDNTEIYDETFNQLKMTIEECKLINN